MPFQNIVGPVVSTLEALSASLGFSLSAIFKDVTTFPLDRFVSAVFVFLLFLLLRHPLRFLLLSLIGRMVSGADPSFREGIVNALRRPVGLLPVVLGTFLAFEIIKMEESPAIARMSDQVTGTLLVLVGYFCLFALIEPIVAQLRPKSGRLTESVVDWVKKALKSLVVFFAFAAVLEQWGVRVGPLLTSFGIVGAAVALGAQSLFKNLISGMLILLEARFQYGDWIKVPGIVEGTVESIGFRSTRVRQFDDAAVQVPNADLADHAVINYTQMRRRRIYWLIGIPYSASIEQLRQIREDIETYIHTSEDFVSYKTASTFVRIDSFGDSAINIMVYCFTQTTNWGEWLAAKERLAVRLMEIVSAAGSSFAFPSTSLYVESLPEGRPDLFLPPDNGQPRIVPAEPELAGNQAAAAQPKDGGAVSHDGNR